MYRREYHDQWIQEIVRAREWARDVRPGVYPAKDLPVDRMAALEGLRDRGITATPLAGGLVWMLEKLIDKGDAQ
jgi:hypothetical protein